MFLDIKRCGVLLTTLTTTEECASMHIIGKIIVGNQIRLRLLMNLKAAQAGSLILLLLIMN